MMSSSKSANAPSQSASPSESPTTIEKSQQSPAETPATSEAQAIPNADEVAVAQRTKEPGVGDNDEPEEEFDRAIRSSGGNDSSLSSGALAAVVVGGAVFTAGATAIGFQFVRRPV